MNEVEVPVLIAGGSLVGLTASVLLATHGVKSLVVERHRGTAIHPRAAMLHQRTTEIFRSAGLEDVVGEAARKEFVQNGAIMACEALGGKELVYFQKNVNEGVEHLSPSSRAFITQIGLEPILRDQARDGGADVRFSTELVSFEQDVDEVRAVIRDRETGEETRVRSKYLIGADGAHSTVREQLGVSMLGRGDFAHCITIYFSADIDALVGDRNLSVVYVKQPGLLGFFRYSIDRDGGFLVVFSAVDENGDVIPDVSVHENDIPQCIRYVRTALGVGDELDITIENVQRWAASAGWAADYGKDRVFLVGDSAHVMPPTGGFGGNTGIVDAHNLAWKIAYVLQGRAPASLLATYDAERRPVGELTSEQAYSRYVLRVDPALGAEDIQPELDDVAIELGPVYASGSIVGSTPTDEPAWQNPREERARLGARLPHLWVDRAGERISTLDVIGTGMALLTGQDGGAWLRAVEALDGEVDGFTVGRDGGLRAEAGAFQAAFGLPEDGALLVRPDGTVAWLADSADSATAAALRAALDGALTRSAVPVSAGT